MKTQLFLAATFLFFVLGISNISFAQNAPAIEWQKSLGGSIKDQGYSAWQTTDEGFIVSGWAYSSDFDVSGHHGSIDYADYWIVKLDASANIEWQKSLGGGGDEVGAVVQQTTDGGYIVAGSSSSNDGDVSGNHLDSNGNITFDFWIVKLSSAGSIEWQKSLGGSKEDRAYSIQQTADGGFIVVGSSDSNDGDVSGNHGDDDYWIVKLDLSGTIEWQKCLGGDTDDAAFSVRQTTDGGFILGGFSYSNDGDVSGNHGDYDYWIVKLDNGGNIEWEKCLGGSKEEFSWSVQQTTDGGFIVGGDSYSNDGDVTGNHDWQPYFYVSDYWIVKLDSSGNIKWQKCLGSGTMEYDAIIQQTTDNGFIVAGVTSGEGGDVSGNHGIEDYWIVKLDSSANIEWQKCLGGTEYDYAFSVQQTSDGGYLIGGSSNSNDGDVTGNHGGIDYWIGKYGVLKSLKI